MILYTIQPIEVYEILKTNGVYYCDENKINEYISKDAYDWMVENMTSPPKDVKYPIWAWYKYDGKRTPDLRTLRWTWGGEPDERFVCMEVEIPDNEVLLSDFDAWHFVLNDCELPTSQEESDMYESMTMTDEVKKKSWKKIFDIDLCSNGFVSDGDYVQATFWMLKLDQVKKVKRFKHG